MIDPGLAGKVALVTGGNNPGGIGAATARALARQGVSVFVHAFRSVTSAQTPDAAPGVQPGEALYLAQQAHTTDALVHEIREDGGQADSWEADLADPAAIPLLFERAEAALGPVEILVNNAAHCQPDTFLPASVLGPNARAVDAFPMRPITATSHDDHLAVNSRAVALAMAEFARRHVERDARWGRIVNVSTDGAYAFPSEVSYGASKLALEAYSRAAAHELGRFGITVNIASLGPIQTGWINPELEAQIQASTPLGRVGHPADVADVIVFLASEQARWLTGQTLFVSGGHRM
jgi:3-oxoacyl-[acyl-carrier protein] reductase